MIPLDDIIPGLPSARRPSGRAAGYNLGFTAASLRPELALIVAEHFLATGDWAVARDRILATNALQCRSASSAQRLERELRQRLETLTPAQLALLSHAPVEDRAAIAWLAACKHIPFVFAFAAEVLRDKLAAHDPILRPSDYEAYLESKSLSHPELARLTASSKYKVRQVLLRMLSEVGLLAPGDSLGVTRRPALSPGVVRVITADSPHWLAGFLVPDSEISPRHPS